MAAPATEWEHQIRIDVCFIGRLFQNMTSQVEDGSQILLAARQSPPLASTLRTSTVRFPPQKTKVWPSS